MKILIKGLGFIGTNLLNSLEIDKDNKIKIISRNFNSFNIKQLKSALKGIDIIYDLSVSWEGGEGEQLINNSFSPFLLASLLNPKQKFIWLSSSAILKKKRNNYDNSKLIAEKAILKLNNSNIKVVRTSDVYGQGQNLGKEILDPEFPARRIQRFIAAYKLIKEGERKELNERFGFIVDNKQLIHEINNDFLHPVYIKDLVDFLVNINSLKSGINELYGPRVSNQELVKIIQKYFKLNIKIRKRGKLVSSRLKSQGKLTSFKRGIKLWLG